MTLNQFIYRMSRPLGGLQLAKFLSRNHPKILMYHRITEDPTGEGLTADQFRQQVTVIKRDFTPMTLQNLLKAHENGKVPKNAVVVTFDDGYRDFKDIAYPILTEYDVPVTLFITTGFINKDIWLWPDQIKYCLQRTDMESVSVGKERITITIRGRAEKAWNEIADYCLEIPNEERVDLINNIYDQLKVAYPDSVPQNYDSLSWNDLRELLERGVDIGSHSVNHPILTRMPLNEVKCEVEESRKLILKELGQEPTVFCYPNGTERDFNESIKRIIDLAGYKYAITAIGERFNLSDRFEIGRYGVGRSFEDFEKKVFGLTYISDRFMRRELG
ncbi:polysaccharide deacetylase family protein [Marinobacter sp. MIT932201]|uniref:polysaccharide deacetylase family protein n=1 Tax=Marinobacter sp. MIT932201 TaxID=3096995 RepID=UPI00399A0F7C